MNKEVKESYLKEDYKALNSIIDMVNSVLVLEPEAVILFLINLTKEYCNNNEIDLGDALLTFNAILKNDLSSDLIQHESRYYIKKR